MRKRMLSILLCLAMTGSMLAGCGSGTSSDTDSKDAQTVEESEADSTEESQGVSIEVETTDEGGYQVNTELDLTEEVTLDIYGPGTFSEADDTTDLISGLTKPGYNAIIERWNELYPNVTLNITPIPWDNWSAAITTACLDGQVDVILHGATLTDLAEDLTPYLEADPEYSEQVYALAWRNNPEDISEMIPTGVPTVLAPVTIWVDTEKFEHFGVELPEDDWTYDDLLALAGELTGTDPVTGEQVYGFQFPWAGGGNEPFNHFLIAQNYGAEIFEYGVSVQESTVNYECEESIQAFQMIADLAQCASPESKEGVSVTYALDGTNNWAIAGGNSGVADYFTMQANGLEGRYVAYNLPVGETGEFEGIPSPGDFDQNISIYKESDSKEWAWEFIKFMTTDEVAVNYIAGNLNLPNNVAGKEIMSTIVDERTANVLDRAYATMPEKYACSGCAAYNYSQFGPVPSNLATAVYDVINGYKTPEEAAEFMQDGVDEYISTLE